MTLSTVADDAIARRQLIGGRLDVALRITSSGARFEVKGALSETVRAVLQAALDAAHVRRALAQARIPISEVLPALAPVPA